MLERSTAGRNKNVNNAMYKQSTILCLYADNTNIDRLEKNTSTNLKTFNPARTHTHADTHI